ncbi:MAG: alpha/beta hydrolase-fold protein [Ruminococcus sp.]
MRKFDPSLLKNNWFLENAISFSESYPEKIRQKNNNMTSQSVEYKNVETGIHILDNGDIRFRMYAPYAGSVDVEIEGDRGPTIALNLRDDGVFEGILPYSPSLIGEQLCNFYVDNTLVVCPTAPVVYLHNRLVNYCDIPDPEVTDVRIENVPHGSVSRELFYSKSLERWMRCFVYLPPEYNRDEKYPVLYLQHGNSGNETTWMYEGKLANMMDNMLARKESVPFIIVMNDGMVRYPSEIEGKNEFFAFTDMLLKDCIPYIDSRFSTKTDKWHRAMAGLSMGSTQTAHITFTHPELFGSIGLFSGCMRGMATDSQYENYEFLEITRHPEVFEKEFRLFFRGIGNLDPTWKNFLRDDGYLTAQGITALSCHRRYVYDGQVHSWGAWRRAFHDFAKQLFKEF